MIKRTLLALLALALLPGAAFAGHQAWVTSNHIQVIDLDSARVVGRIPLQEFIHDLEFSPDGATAYVASSHGLRLADANALAFTQRISEASTRGLTLSADGSRLAALHRAPGADALTARKAGLPLPPSTLAIYGTNGMTLETSFPVSGDAFDLALAADGQSVFVLVPQQGTVYQHALDGSLLRSFELVKQGSGTEAAMLSELALSPDGRTLVVPVTDANESWLAQIDLAPQAAEPVQHQGLGHARRIQGLRWAADGSGVLVTAVNSMVKFNGLGLPVAWQAYPQNFVDVQSIPGGQEAAVVTPTFSKENGSGGVAVLAADGSVLRSLELPDMSPFLVAVRP